MLNKCLLFFTTILCWCCRPPTPVPYASKDFSPALQTLLNYKVSKAFVGFGDGSLSNMLTDNELTQLSRCEHPVLRAIAFREMLERRSFDHFRVIMEHLDDTAIVTFNEGEWGLGYSTIADDIIRNAGWKTNEDIMSRYPNNEYLEVFEAYYPRLFYRTLCLERSETEAVNFINSVAVYKNERSARVLDSILNRKPFINCEADTSYLKSVVRNAIWDNPCPAYVKLRAQVEAKVKEDLKNALEIEPAPPIESTDSSDEKIRW